MGTVNAIIVFENRNDRNGSKSFRARFLAVMSKYLCALGIIVFTSRGNGAAALEAGRVSIMN